MRIEWTTSARVNLQELYDYISKDSPRNAERFIARLFDAIDHLADQPKMGRAVPEADNGDDVRELIFQNYRIIYYLEAEYVYIVNVIHGSRDLKRLKVKPWEVK